MGSCENEFEVHMLKLIGMMMTTTTYDDDAENLLSVTGWLARLIFVCCCCCCCCCCWWVGLTPNSIELFEEAHMTMTSYRRRDTILSSGVVVSWPLCSVRVSPVFFWLDDKLVISKCFQEAHLMLTNLKRSALEKRETSSII
jgi:hypothetical protein